MASETCPSRWQYDLRWGYQEVAKVVAAFGGQADVFQSLLAAKSDAAWPPLFPLECL